ncbi:cyclic nucleotide-binding domain-containing protein [Gilvimarinus agarilyticus]|uniref:cyclic nucleotide-binding domain-containing protein n=1 Tax=Gilvimarinus agarilyticus TaxID=679259 RepID=UPI0006992148|nr:cyclic nucleotide-binding domain-containing protein [Gilvimarinus agarilyticus]
MSSANLMTSNQSEIDLADTRSLTPLKYMSEAHLQVLLADAQKQYLYAGQNVWRRGAMDGRSYFLLFGDVTLEDASGACTTLKGRDTTVAITPNEPREHEVTAVSDCALLSLDTEQMDKLLCWSQVADYLHTKIARDRDMDEDVDWMMQVLHSNLFFKVPPINVKVIFEHMQVRLVEPGERVIRQGEVGDQCYFIKEGSAEVTREQNGSVQHLAHIHAGRCFGEDALVNDAPRNASVTMTSKGVLMCLPKQDFYRLLRAPEVPTVSLEALAGLGKAPVVIDVRSEQEYSTGHFPGAVNLPLHLLAIKARLLVPGVDYVLYCNSGRRAEAATHLLQGEGISVKCLSDSDQLFNPSSPLALENDNNYVLRDGLAVPGQ